MEGILTNRDYKIHKQFLETIVFCRKYYLNSSNQYKYYFICHCMLLAADRIKINYFIGIILNDLLMKYKPTEKLFPEIYNGKYFVKDFNDIWWMIKCVDFKKKRIKGNSIAFITKIKDIEMHREIMKEKRKYLLLLENYIQLLILKYERENS